MKHCLFALALSVICLPVTAGEVDLTALDSRVVVNDGLFIQFEYDSSTGTGVIDPFVRIQANGTAKGFNTTGAFEFDEKDAEALLLSAIPVVNIGGTDYREFLLDINQSSSEPFLSLDELQIYLGSVPDPTFADLSAMTAIYDLDSGQDNWIKLDYSNETGSGSGDMLALIPDSFFGSDETLYVYLYSAFGTHYSANDGFEEWAVGQNGPIIPEPATVAIFGVGMLLVRRFRRGR